MKEILFVWSHECLEFYFKTENHAKSLNATFLSNELSHVWFNSNDPTRWSTSEYLWHPYLTFFTLYIDTSTIHFCYENRIFKCAEFQMKCLYFRQM